MTQLTILGETASKRTFIIKSGEVFLVVRTVFEFNPEATVEDELYDGNDVDTLRDLFESSKERYEAVEIFDRGWTYLALNSGGGHSGSA